MSAGISALVVERHASEAALLWPLRDAAAREPGYDLDGLGGLDERVEANLDGLRLAGELGADAARAALADGAGPGEVFTATAIAVDRGDLRGIAAVLDVAAAKPALARGFVAALGWCRYESLAKLLPGLLSPKSPGSLQRLGIAACAAHRRHPGPVLAGATASSEVRLRTRALRAIGELGTRELLDEVRGDLGNKDERCRFAAAWTCTLLGDTEGIRTLSEIGSSGGDLAVPACDLAMRRSAPVEASRWLEHLSRSETTRRAAIAGAAALGDPTAISWLVELTEDEAHARPALRAVTTIVGLDARRAGLVEKARKKRQRTPNDDPRDPRVAPDPDAGLEWPDAAALRSFWTRERGRYPRGTRLLLGRTPSTPWLSEVLRRGAQPERAAAALELTLLSPGTPLFAVRAPAFRQAAVLG
jgi:uncharacterized protein (TIGR02270 family)